MSGRGTSACFRTSVSNSAALNGEKCTRVLTLRPRASRSTPHGGGGSDSPTPGGRAGPDGVVLAATLAGAYHTDVVGENTRSTRDQGAIGNVA